MNLSLIVSQEMRQNPNFASIFFVSLKEEDVSSLNLWWEKAVALYLFHLDASYGFETFQEEHSFTVGIISGGIHKTN